MLNPSAVQMMREVAIDISARHSKSAGEFLGRSIQCVVTVCANARENYTVLPADFQVPARGSDDEKLAVFRKGRDEIRANFECECGAGQVPDR